MLESRKFQTAGAHPACLEPRALTIEKLGHLDCRRVFPHPFRPREKIRVSQPAPLERAAENVLRTLLSYDIIPAHDSMGRVVHIPQKARPIPKWKTPELRVSPKNCF